MRVTSINGYGELLERGLATMPLVCDPAAALAELEERLRDPDVALFVSDGETAEICGDAIGFLIAENNRSAFVGACVVIHFYVERREMRRDVLRGLLEELRAFGNAGGLARFHGCDINELSETAYRRLLKGLPRVVRRIGALYELRE